ncbi:MAG TPA: hypothetical protein VJ944_00305 [Thermoplasmataceae archaeon]|nr:hypothetical protein [Thermoplasmataceae archaeon]
MHGGGYLHGYYRSLSGHHEIPSIPGGNEFRGRNGHHVAGGLKL